MFGITASRFALACSLTAALVSGCSPAPAPEMPKPAKAAAAPAKEHDHPSEGPHHGSLIELGNEEYHAELVHDEANGTVTIYLLDSGAKGAVAIEATDVAINLKQDGKPAQFKLPAEPDAADTAGKSSRFASKDAELAKALDAEGAEPRLVVKIDGKSYTGKLAHDHDHDHKHDEDHK